MLVTQQIIHNLFSALRFQENYKAVLCTCAGSHYKLSTVCSVLFVFRKITKQCSALVPALITNYLQFVYCSSFSGKLQSSAMYLCRLHCNLSTICSLLFVFRNITKQQSCEIFVEMKLWNDTKGAEHRNIYPIINN